MKSNWRRHRDQAYTPCTAAVLKQGCVCTPRRKIESVQLLVLLHSTQFLMVWHVMASSCSPPLLYPLVCPSTAALSLTCVLEQTHCTLQSKTKKARRLWVDSDSA